MPKMIDIADVTKENGFSEVLDLEKQIYVLI